MLYKIFHTLGARLLTALLGFALLFLTANLMGAEARGQIGLLILNLSLASIVSGFVGGPALVYVVPRVGLRTVMVLSLLWACVAVAGFALVVHAGGLLPFMSTPVFASLALAESLVATNLMVLLGKQKVGANNMLLLLKAAIPVAGIYVMNCFEAVRFDAFVLFYGVALAATLAVSSLLVLQLASRVKTDAGLWETLRMALRFGALSQSGNIAQLLNYRLSYYLLELLISPPQLALVKIGLFHTATQVAETLLYFARSVNTVQYATVANISDRARALRLSLRLVKLNTVISAMGLIVLTALPNSVFVWALGAEFSDMKPLFMILAPGVLSLAFAGGISHFFGGIGDARYNTKMAIYGLVLAAALCYPAIRYFGEHGAALSTTFVYLFQSLWLFLQLKKTDGVRLRDVVPTWDDIVWLKDNFTGVKGN